MANPIARNRFHALHRITAARSIPAVRITCAVLACLTLGFGLAIGLGTPLAAADETAERPAAATPENEAPWRSLFDGKSLEGWRPTRFGGEGEAYVEDGKLMLDFGSPLTGVTYTGGALPTSNYEIRLEAQRLEGSDFFCGLTFPVGNSHCSLIVGGWGGSLVGLSSLDGKDASDNETGRNMPFRRGQWYRIRVQVAEHRIRAWIDDQPIIDQDTMGRKVSLRAEVQLSKPLGICSFETRAALRNLAIRSLADDRAAGRRGP
jgi:hypothetical protein